MSCSVLLLIDAIGHEILLFITVGIKWGGDRGFKPQEAQAQNENTIELQNMTFAVRLCMGNSLWFSMC